MSDEFGRAIESLGPNEGFRVEDLGKDLQLEFMPLARIIAEVCTAERVSFMGVALDPGVALFIRAMEVKYFQPRTPRNDLLAHYVVRWQGYPWTLISFPATAINPLDALRLASACDLDVSPAVCVQLGPGEAMGAASRPVPNQELFAGGWVMPDFPDGRMVYVASRPTSVCHSDPERAFDVIVARLGIPEQDLLRG